MKYLSMAMMAFALFTMPLTAHAEDGAGKKHHGERFKEADKNGDGAISKSEFMDQAEKRAKERFDKMDSNGDGQITKDEIKSKMGEWREKHGDRMKERREGRIEKAE